MNRLLKQLIATALLISISSVAFSQQSCKITIEEIDRKKPVATDKILTLIQEIVEKLKEQEPELLKSRTEADIERIARAFVRGFQCELNYIKADGKTSHLTVPPVSNHKFPPLLLNNKQILYQRIDAFSNDTFNIMSEHFSRIAAKKPALAGIIIDLRNCSGYDKPNALKCLALLCPHEQLPSIPGKVQPRAFRKITAVLIGPRTTGSAEFFARQVKSTKTGLTAGEPTAGKPFKTLLLKLKNGNYLAVPEFPKGIKHFCARAIKPIVPVKSAPQIDYVALKQSTVLGDRDHCLQHAADLLISLNALKPDLRKKGK